MGDPGAAAAATPKRSVGFSDCTILSFSVALDPCKLPSDGVAPLGLGVLVATETQRVDAYEAARECERRSGASLSCTATSQWPGRLLRQRAVHSAPHTAYNVGFTLFLLESTMLVFFIDFIRNG